VDKKKPPQSKFNINFVVVYIPIERENFYYNNNNKGRFLSSCERHASPSIAPCLLLFSTYERKLCAGPSAPYNPHPSLHGSSRPAHTTTHAHSWHIVNLFFSFRSEKILLLFIYLLKKKKLNNYLCVPEFEWVLKMRPIRPVRAVPGIECVEIVDWAVEVEATSKSYAVCAFFYLCRWPGFPIPMNLYLNNEMTIEKG
jgi:hypothetical protein